MFDVTILVSPAGTRPNRIDSPDVPDPSLAGRPGATEERILRATLRLVGRRGVKRLGMQEVSEAAGISRGTLYRYFPSKECLIDAVAVFDERSFNDGLADSLAECEDPADRIRTFVAFAFDYIRTHPARALFESDPGFVLGYLLVHLPKLQVAMLTQLGDALDTVPAVATGRLSRAQLVDVVVRLFASSFIIPEPDDRALVQSLSGLLLPTPAQFDPKPTGDQ
jgi:AcrR family transcriptional regulator